MSNELHTSRIPWEIRDIAHFFKTVREITNDYTTKTQGNVRLFTLITDRYNETIDPISRRSKRTGDGVRYFVDKLLHNFWKDYESFVQYKKRNGCTISEDYFDQFVRGNRRYSMFVDFEEDMMKFREFHIGNKLFTMKRPLDTTTSTAPPPPPRKSFPQKTTTPPLTADSSSTFEEQLVAEMKAMSHDVYEQLIIRHAKKLLEAPPASFSDYQRTLLAEYERLQVQSNVLYCSVPLHITETGEDVDSAYISEILQQKVEKDDAAADQEDSLALSKHPFSDIEQFYDVPKDIPVIAHEEEEDEEDSYKRKDGNKKTYKNIYDMENIEKITLLRIAAKNKDLQLMRFLCDILWKKEDIKEIRIEVVNTTPTKIYILKTTTDHACMIVNFEDYVGLQIVTSLQHSVNSCDATKIFSFLKKRGVNFNRQDNKITMWHYESKEDSKKAWREYGEDDVKVCEDDGTYNYEYDTSDSDNDEYNTIDSEDDETEDSDSDEDVCNPPDSVPEEVDAAAVEPENTPGNLEENTLKTPPQNNFLLEDTEDQYGWEFEFD